MTKVLIQQKVEQIKTEIRKVMDKHEDRSAIMCHYFLWAVIRVEGSSKDTKECVGSGISSDTPFILTEINKMPEVVGSWINWD